MKFRARLSLHATAAALLIACMCLSGAPGQELRSAPTNVLIVVDPSTHPPGTNEVAAGARLLEHCLTHAENVPGIQAHAVSNWPGDRKSLQNVATVVFTGDRFPPEEMPDRERIMADLTT